MIPFCSFVCRELVWDRIFPGSSILLFALVLYCMDFLGPNLVRLTRNRLVRLVFSAGTVFFSHNNSARTVFFSQFQPSFSKSNGDVSCCIFFKLPGRRGREIGLSFLYLVGGYYSFVSSMALAPYRALYAMAIIGYICFISRIIERRNMVRGDISSRRSRKHSHRH